MQHHFLSARFAALRIDELMRLGGAINTHPTVFANGVLHHHYRVGADRHGRAGHDLDCLSSAHFAEESFAGAHFADDLQLAGEVDGAHGEAIAHGAGESGDIAVGGHVFGEHTSHGG